MRESKRTKELLLEQLKKNPIAQIACEKVGVSRASFYTWKRKDKAFAAQIEEALADGQSLVNDLAESQLINAVKDRNFTAIMYWLKHHHPSYKTKVEIEGQIEVIKELSPEQKELVRRALTLASVILNNHEQEQQ